jgi:hypothetical protein
VPVIKGALALSETRLSFKSNPSMNVDLLYHHPDKSGQYELQTGIYYLPVYANLSNWMEQTEYVMDPSDDAAVQAIVRNVQDGCRKHVVAMRFVEDVLTDLWGSECGSFGSLETRLV